jgi:hypothetical protein
MVRRSRRVKINKNKKPKVSKAKRCDGQPIWEKVSKPATNKKRQGKQESDKREQTKVPAPKIELLKSKLRVAKMELELAELQERLSGLKEETERTSKSTKTRESRGTKKSARSKKSTGTKKPTRKHENESSQQNKNSKDETRWSFFEPNNKKRKTDEKPGKPEQQPPCCPQWSKRACTCTHNDYFTTRNWWEQTKARREEHDAVIKTGISARSKQRQHEASIKLAKYRREARASSENSTTTHRMDSEWKKLQSKCVDEDGYAVTKRCLSKKDGQLETWNICFEAPYNYLDKGIELLKGTINFPSNYPFNSPIIDFNNFKYFLYDLESSPSASLDSSFKMIMESFDDDEYFYMSNAQSSKKKTKKTKAQKENAREDRDYCYDNLSNNDQQ